ncbi:MAG: Clp protease N-terminal domain-containing protein [Acidimicrobiia bacterium]
MQPLEFQRLVRSIESSGGSDPLRRLTDAVILAARIEEMADDLIGHFVEEARSSGASWADIGQSMGMTRQAAQKRFVGRRSRRGKRSSFFLTRFADEARGIVRGAERVARSAGSDHIGTEHLILSLVDNRDGIATRALSELGASVDQLRETSKSALTEGTEAQSQGHIPFAADMKKVLELSLRETIRSHDKHITEKHILLALLRDDKSFGPELLKDNGITRKGFEQWCEDNAV